LTEAAAKVPGGVWVFGPVALGAAAALVLGLALGSRNLAFFGGSFTLVFCVLFYVFAKGTASKRSLDGPFRTLVWSIVLLFLILLATLYSCVFWAQPLDLRDWVKTVDQQVLVAKYDILDSKNSPVVWIANENAVEIEADDPDLAPRVMISQHTVIVTFQNRLDATLVLKDVLGHRSYRHKISPGQARKTLRVPADFSVSPL